MIKSRKEKEVGLSEEEKKIASKLKELAAAEDLDDLEECEPFDSQVFDGFWDEFLGSEEIDRYTVEAWFIIPDSDDEGEVIGWLKS